MKFRKKEEEGREEEKKVVVVVRGSGTEGVTRKEARDEPGKLGGARLGPQSFHLSNGNNIGSPEGPCLRIR